MKKMIIIGVAVLLLAGIAGGAFWFLKKEDPQELADGIAAEEPTPEVADPIYTSLDPDFIIAFQEPKNARFLKLAVDVMTRDDDVIEDIKLHIPAIRDAVVMLLSGTDEAELFSAEGKQTLREEILAAVQAVLEENTGRPGVEAIYFSNFVMQ